MKLSFFVLLFISLFFFQQSTKALPLHLGKAATKLLLSILGKGTYYSVSAGVGSCGEMSGDSDMVVAVNHVQMNNGANPNNNPLCNKKVKILGTLGVPVVARIVDTCPGCDEGCLDMSPSLFQKVCGGLDLGVCKITWDFV